jgi:hypothetical protein
VAIAMGQTRTAIACLKYRNRAKYESAGRLINEGL